MSEAVFVQKGAAIDYTPTEAAVDAGDIVFLANNYAGVAEFPIAQNAMGSLAVTGIFKCAKDENAITAGALVYWNSVTSKVSATPAPDCYIGRAVAAASDDKCRVALNASNIGDFTPIVPGTSPVVTQETFAALTAENPAEINAADPTVTGPTTTGIEGSAYATEAAAIKAAIEQNDTNVDAVKAALDDLIDDVTSTRTQLVAAIADLATLRTAVNAGKFDLAAVVTQLKAASVLD